MQTPFPSEIPQQESHAWREDRLDSWKEIAAFFRREVRTVQLWEKGEGLPVHRQHHRKLGTVYAYRRELEAWWIARSALRIDAPVPVPPAKTVHPEPAAIIQQLERKLDLRLAIVPFEIIELCSQRPTSKGLGGLFARGVLEDLIVELSRSDVQSVLVPLGSIRPPTTASDGLIRTIAREYGTRGVVTGSIRTSNDRAVVTVRLIDATGTACLWSDRFESSVGDILKAQSGLAGQVAGSLRTALANLLRTPQPGEHEPGAPAELAYRMGLYFWRQRSHTALIKAAAYFRDAIDLDPGFAPSHAGLADCCVSMSFHHLMPAREAMECANAAASSAMRLDPHSAAIRNSMTNVVLNCNWDWSKAERHSLSCMESEAANSRTLQLHSNLTSSRGRHQEATDAALAGLRTDPHSDAINAQVGFAHYYSANYDAALPYVHRSIALNGSNEVPHTLLAMVEAERGNWNEALAAVTDASLLSDGSSYVMALKAYVYARSGERAAAATLVHEIEAGRYTGSSPAYDLAAAYAALGQHKPALANLRKAYAGRDMKVIFMKQDPKLFPLQRSHEFQELASAMHLA